MMVVFRRTLFQALATMGGQGGTRLSSSSSSTNNMVIMLEELKLPCSDGIILAAQRWSVKSSPFDNDTRKNISLDSFDTTKSNVDHRQEQEEEHGPQHLVLCLHGWLDNCRSFHSLAPFLATNFFSKYQKEDQYDNYEHRQAEIIALDLVGHGQSSHRSFDAPPAVQSEMVFYVSEAISSLLEGTYEISSSCVVGSFNHPGSSTHDDDDDNDVDTYTDSLSHDSKKVTLIGHSLGAGISSLYSACFPEQVRDLVLLDGAGFLAREAKDTGLHVRNHITSRQQYNHQMRPQQEQGKTTSTLTKKQGGQNRHRRAFPSLDVAIKLRRQNAARMPGRQRLSYQAAKELVQRAVEDIPDESFPIDESNDDGRSRSEEGDIAEAKVRFRHDARYNWPSIQYMTEDQIEGIFAAVQADCCILLAEEGFPFETSKIERAKELLRPVHFETLPGSHYFHADPETSEAVAKAVFSFLSRERN